MIYWVTTNLTITGEGLDAFAAQINSVLVPAGGGHRSKESKTCGGYLVF